MTSQLKSSFSISSLIQPSKTDRYDSANTSYPIITSSTTTPSTSYTDRVWNPVYISPHGVTPYIGSVYGFPVMNGTVTTPPPSPTLQQTFQPVPSIDTVTPGIISLKQQTPGSDAPLTPRHSPSNNNSLSPDTSLESEGNSASSSPRSQRKSGRMSYSSAQASRLESVFLTTPYPDSHLYETLTEELDLPAKKLKVWFQNKRARSKRRVSEARMTNLPQIYPVHPIYMSPTVPSTVAPYPYMMPGVMMTQPSVMMTPPSSPVEMQMMQHPFFTFPTTYSPMMQSANPYNAPPSGVL